MLTFNPKFPISCVTKNKGPLTKIMSFDPHTGQVVKDGSECSMHSGIIKQIGISSPEGFAKMLDSRKSNQAIVHGFCQYDYARVVTKGKVGKASISSELPVIARTKEYITYHNGPGVILFDHDKARAGSIGSDEALASYTPETLIAVLAAVHLEIGKAAFVSTPSTSSCIYNAEGEMLRGEGTGSHSYLFVKNASDIPRYLKTLGQRLFLAGLGRIEISRSGALLERTLVDLLVGSPERLDFVAGAVCRDGLVQKLPPPAVHDGEMLDTSTLQDLSTDEEQQYQSIVAALKNQAKPQQEKVGAEYIEHEAGKLAQSGALSIEDAKRIITFRQDHVLDDGDILFFAHQNAGVAVAEVLDNGSAYHGKSLADPLEPDYEGGSKTKAKFYWNDGSPVVHSYAHGSKKYRFRRFVKPTQAFATVMFNEDREAKVIDELAAILDRDGALPTAVWCEKLLAANLSSVGQDEVYKWLVSRDIGGKRALSKTFKAFESVVSSKKNEDMIAKLAGKRRVIRFNQLFMNDSVLDTEQAVIQVPGKWPFFSFGGAVCYWTYDRPAAFSGRNSDQIPPQIPVIKTYNYNSLQMRVEQSALHVVRSEKDGVEELSPIPTPDQIVRKMLDNPASLAPKVQGLVTHPLVAQNGRGISTEGYDEQTGLFFAFGGAKFTVPTKPSPKAAQAAFDRINSLLFGEFQFKETPDNGDLYSAAAVALLLTGFYRKLLDQAPGGLVTATTQGSGKTTLLRMIHIILNGRDMPVSSLSDNSEENAKAMLAALLESPAMLCFDNLPDGFEINDSTLAKAITSPIFKGRILGKSQEVSVPTATLFAITGNNLTLSCDLLRRFLTVQLESSSARPEQRSFKHRDIVQRVLEIREQVVLDCLTMVKAYIDAGSPLDREDIASSGFAAWDHMVRFPVFLASGVDVLQTFELGREESSENQAMSGIIKSLWAMYRDLPFTASALLRELQREGLGDFDRDTVDHLKECLVMMAVKSIQNTRSLSFALKKLAGRVIDGKRLMHHTDKFGNRGSFRLSQNNGTDGNIPLFPTQF